MNGVQFFLMVYFGVSAARWAWVADRYQRTIEMQRRELDAWHAAYQAQQLVRRRAP